MIKPKIPKNEAERLHALRTLRILDTSGEERFDRVTRMAKRMFGVQISLVSLIDEKRQWFKSKQGLDASETPREISFCGHAINQDELFIISNALEDERFADNPLVTDDPNIRFYAGYPLKIKQGLNLGTLCIIDSHPKILEEEDKQLLLDLGAMIEQEIQSIQLATLDELTMISNRRGFLTLAEHCRKVCIRKKLNMHLALFDLDKFKPINDQCGHQEGDFVLQKFAETMQRSFRESDIIGRIGGDEFVVMIADSDNFQLQSVLQRFRKTVKEINQEINKPYAIEYSAGVVSLNYDTDITLEKMLELADADMYSKKKCVRS